MRTSAEDLIEAREQPPVPFFHRKPGCPEAQCLEKLDRVSLDRRIRIFRDAEMNGDFTPGLHR